MPRSGRYPGGRQSNPLQYSCLELLMDRGAWRASVHGITKSQTQAVLTRSSVTISSCASVMWRLSLAAFRILSFSLDFRSLIIMCLGVIFFVFILPGSTEFFEFFLIFLKIKFVELRPIFLQILIYHKFFLFLDSNHIVWWAAKVVFISPQSFPDWMFYIDIQFHWLPVLPSSICCEIHPVNFSLRLLYVLVLDFSKISGKEYWSGLPFPPPGKLPKPRVKPATPMSPALQVGSFLLSHQGSPQKGSWKV